MQRSNQRVNGQIPERCCKSRAFKAVGNTRGPKRPKRGGRQKKKLKHFQPNSFRKSKKKQLPLTKNLGPQHAGGENQQTPSARGGLKFTYSNIR